MACLWMGVLATWHICSGKATVAHICTYCHISEDMVIKGICSHTKRAGHFWPGGGNSSTAPLPIYEKGLSLNTGDRMHTTMHQSQNAAARVLTRSANEAGASTDFVSQAERKALLLASVRLVKEGICIRTRSQGSIPRGG